MLSIAFDCDGTLVDSEPLHNRADVAILSQLGIVIDPDEHRHRSTGVGRASMLRIIEQEHGVRLPPDTEERIEAELQRLVVAELQPVAAVPHVLDVLAKRGARMAVASNSPCVYIDQALRTCGIREHFGDRISAADRVAHLKPAPDIYLLAADLLEAAPTHCVAVEDSLAGVIAAHAARMRTIAFCPPDHVFTPAQLTNAGAEQVISDFRQLLDIVG